MTYCCCPFTTSVQGVALVTGKTFILDPRLFALDLGGCAFGCAFSKLVFSYTFWFRWWQRRFSFGQYWPWGSNLNSFVFGCCLLFPCTVHIEDELNVMVPLRTNLRRGFIITRQNHGFLSLLSKLQLAHNSYIVRTCRANAPHFVSAALRSHIIILWDCVQGLNAFWGKA